MNMAPEHNQILDDLLSRWHQWRQRAQVGRGFNRKALVVGDFRVSRQYDDVSGALDDDLEDGLMRQVEFEATELPQPFYIAICCNAQAIALGVFVVMNPRLPADKEARRRLIEAARIALTRRLVAAGVI